MVNPRLLEQAKRLMNDKIPEPRPKKSEPEVPTPPKKSEPEVPTPPVTSITGEPFILKYDQFGKELIKKSNEYFKGTKAEISLVDNNGNPLTGEVKNMYWIKRGGLTTAIYKDKQLQSLNLWPITPEQSELLLKQGKLPKDASEFWEDLALILYDRSTKWGNPKEAKALYDSLKAHKQELNLSNSDLEERLLVINAGIEKDSKFPHKVKPVVLPGLTQVYVHETLKKTGDHKFEYGLEHGLPAVNELGKGNRTLYMPSDNKDIGLRVFCRGMVLGLDARFESLVNSYSDGRVVFAQQAYAMWANTYKLRKNILRNIKTKPL